MPRAAVLAIARVELRRRWRSMVALGLLAGLVGAVVTGSVALARRTVTAHDRLAAATHLDDARVLLASEVVTPEEISRLPGVRQVWTTRQVIGQLVGGPSVSFASVTSSPDDPKGLFTPVIVRGREPRPDRAGEVVVPEVYTEEAGIGLGDTLRLKLLSPAEVTQFDTGFGAPDGPLVKLRVVGIARTDRDWIGNGVGPVFATPAFYAAHQPSQIGHDLLLRLAGGQDGVARFRRALEPLAARTPTDESGREFGVLQATYPSSVKEPSVAAARHTLGVGLLVFIVVAGLGGLLAVGQGLARHHALGTGEQRVEAALGLTRAERVAARLLPAAVGAAVAAGLAIAGGLASAGLEPVGAMGAYEPIPGWQPNGAIIAACGATTALLFLAISAVTAARAVPPSQLSHRSAPAVTPSLGMLGRAAPTVAGLSFALSGGRGRGAVPVRTTMASAVLGIVGVVTVTAFGASLHQLENEPERYGWTGDFAIVDYRPEMLSRADRAAISDIAVVSDTTARAGAADGRQQPIDVIALRHEKGHLPVTTLAGRLPRQPWEVALGSKVARQLGLSTGDPIRFTTRSGAPQRGRVVGILVNPDVNDIGVGMSSVVTPATLTRLGEITPFRSALVRVPPGADAQKVFDRLARRLEMQRSQPPQDVRNLVDLGLLPGLLAAFLAAAAAAVLAHGLAVTIRRRGRDLAVLRAIGFTPRQVAGSLVTAALTAAAIGLLIGVPLGLALGRLVWFQVASGSGLAGDMALPTATLVVLAPATLATAALVALLPARRAARQRPAVALREE